MRLLSVFAAALLFVTAARASDTVATASHEMVVAANPYATKAGLDILHHGGNAVDAAIAVQLVLGLVEPQSSGIGGGAFMLYYQPTEDGKAPVFTAYDGRETAPMADKPDMFADEERSYQGFLDAVLGGRSVGTPGVLAMLKKAHDDHGRMPWKDLFTRAIKLAKDGFIVSPRLHYLLRVDPLLRKVPKTRAYFYDNDGKALKAGTRLQNPAYAHSLTLIRDNGIDVFYNGEIAKEIVDAVQNAPVHPGHLALGDLAAYQAKARTPVCAFYREVRVCGMPPPSSGGTTVLAILGLLEPFDVAKLKPNSVDAVHLITQTERLAYADRDHYVADADFVAVPVAGLIDKAYLRERSSLISMKHDMGTARYGLPPTGPMTAWGDARTPMLHSTSHFVITDKWGGVLSMTSSVENAFGSRLMAGGFILNNQLTDFAFHPVGDDGQPVANALAPGKRPRSSMAPTIVFDREGRPTLAVGTPGGNAIIALVAKALIGALDWKLDIQQAVSLPNFYNLNKSTVLEEGTVLEEIKGALEARGHTVTTRSITSGLHGLTIEYHNGGRTIRGGADPRREGVALGD